MEEVAWIRHLHEQGMGIRNIARELEISRNTVRKYVRSDEEVKFHKPPPRTNILAPHREWLRELFFQHEGNADVLRQELSVKGIVVSRRAVQRFVKCWRDELGRRKQATVRYETPPGLQMQIDFGEKTTFMGSEQVTVHLFVAKLGYSRRIFVKAFRHENQQAWMMGVEEAMRCFGGKPQQLLIDNPKAMVMKHDPATGEVQFNEKFKAFADYWGITLRACVPARAQTKGKVENGVKYVKNNCIAGRRFKDWEDLERHIAQWLGNVSDARVLDTQETPLQRFEMERTQLKPLEGRPPFSPTCEGSRKVAKDCFVEVERNYYSVPWQHIKTTVRVHVTETEVVVLQGDGTEIARHARLKGFGERSVKPEHFKGIVYQRDEDRAPREAKGGEKSAAESSREPVHGELERSLEVYEAAV